MKNGDGALGKAGGLYLDCRYAFVASIGRNRLKRPRVSFPALRRRFRRDGVEFRSQRAYVSYREADATGEHVSGFSDFLRNSGFEVRCYPYTIEGRVNTRWFSELLVNILDDVKEKGLDTVVICSGSGGLVEIVKHIQKLGVKVAIAAFEYNVSRELREAADIFTSLDRFAYEAAPRGDFEREMDQEIKDQLTTKPI